MFLTRVEKVKKQLSEKNLDAVLISSPAAVTYLTGYANFPVSEREMFLLITQDKNFLLTHTIYSAVLKGKIPNFEVVEISRRLPPQRALLKLLKNQQAVKLGIEENNLTVSEYKSLSKVFKNLKNYETKIHRTVKNPAETDLIEKACEIGDRAFAYILKEIKLGVSEKGLAFKLEYFIKNLGADLSFPTIAAFGINSFAPHHQTSDKKLGKGEFVLLDFGVRWQNYCSDMTRTVVFDQASKEQKRIYETVLTAQNKAISLIEEKIKQGRPIKASEVDKAARQFIGSQGYPDIPHSVGHGIGLEVHEHPYLSKNSKEVLREGMVFSIEPGIYLPTFGGVRIEDLFALEKGKLKRLTKSENFLSALS